MRRHKIVLIDCHPLFGDNKQPLLSTCATRLGNIWKFLAKKFIAKQAPIFGNLFELFEKDAF